MQKYQVLARKYRPQQFCDVVGQEALVTTLVNAIKFERLAHAYLFCGSRGCGKTSIARIFAKALNCSNLSKDFEPCNACPSCKEITAGCSLDVLEIDGASNRGIDDIRSINETVSYSPSSGKYKIYLIDEVHMLTKEAFNALLKTLEEPPATVKFFFATTEPHKIPSTILSRCQRFQLLRISLDKIVEKLRKIAKDVKVDVDTEALLLIAKNAEGSLRDAESLFDQIISFEKEKITTESIIHVFGLMPTETFFKLDLAGKKGDLACAFDIAHQVFLEGKNIFHFLDGLIEHFRNLLLVKVSPLTIAHQVFSPADRETYQKHGAFYSQEQCLDLLNYLIETRQEMKNTNLSQIALEAILLHILRSHGRISVEVLTKKLSEIEQTIQSLVITEPSKNTPIPPSVLLEEKPSWTPSAPNVDISEKKPSSQRATLPKDSIAKGRDDTIMRFAAIELEGTLKKILS
ncbi:MAG: DNA polymerase III subunit gamma/tau [Chlamydiales bacterium]|nr:DNA polymerase III subunit gamma/tau [Chlamydiales bacterium]